MGFLDSVGDWFTGAAKTIDDSVLQPVFHIGVKAYDTVGGAVTAIGNKVDRVLEAGVGVVEHGAGAVSGFADFMKNPVVLIGGMVIGGLLLSKLIK